MFFSDDMVSPDHDPNDIVNNVSNNARNSTPEAYARPDSPLKSLKKAKISAALPGL